MSWIRTVPYEDATGKLKRLYDRVKGPDDNVDNIMMAHSLRPHSMEGHMAVYKYVLHHTGNTLPKWYLECIGTYVSSLNACNYCVEHHFQGMRRLLDDEPRSTALRAAIEAGDITSAPLDGREMAGMEYARKLTVAPATVREADMTALRDAGFDDGEILEINQVSAYFSYANRTVLGLGVSTQGDVIGLSPNNSENPDDWSHR
ncbi:peroxidase-related enzyme [Lentibacter algarum]|uniref:carboxymuconolactone decarboxylase family protein n=1 Tax=Lentibacter algarum TaxID=576131 RepID=UPI001C095247|nr:peroxidase-related enzyme [Lentibacter algarum]MBU2983241.1 peroxidase-related enzyme [Lentibacter algarum]